MRDGVVDGNRLTFRLYPGDTWQSWCSLQTYAGDTCAPECAACNGTCGVWQTASLAPGEDVQLPVFNDAGAAILGPCDGGIRVPDGGTAGPAQCNVTVTIPRTKYDGCCLNACIPAASGGWTAGKGFELAIDVTFNGNAASGSFVEYAESGPAIQPTVIHLTRQP